MAGFETVGRKAELIAELARARIGMDQSRAALRRDANIPAHVSGSFQRHKSIWLGFAALIGWVLARLPARKKKVKVFVDKHDKETIGTSTKKSPSLLLGLLGMAMQLIKPTVTAYLTSQLTKKAAKEGELRPERGR